MSKPTQAPKKSRFFWLCYAAAILILSLGCVAGDEEDLIGEVGVCGSAMEHWSEARGASGSLGFYHALNVVASNSNPLYYEFNPVVVEGSLNTYYVSHWGTGEPARIAQITTSNPDIISVRPLNQSNQDYFDIEAIRPGEAELTVYTSVGTIDRIRLFVTDLARVDAYHCCSDSSQARYLTNSEIEVPITYSSSAGERAIGFGVFPFDISDRSRLEWLPGVPDPSDLHFVTGSQTGRVTLQPRIAGQALTMELIDPSDVDGISPHWKPDGASRHQWFVGAVLYENDEEICAGKYPMRVTTQTPEVCDLIGADNQAYRVFNFAGDETVLVDTYQDAECELLFELLDDQNRVIVSETTINDLSDADYSRRNSRPY